MEGFKSPIKTPLEKENKPENNEISEAPEGWMTTNGLVKELEISSSTIKNIADIYLQSNPEYFSDFKGGSGNKNVHYSPELVKIIKKNLLARLEPLEGWMTNGPLSDELKTSSATTKKIADRYLKSNPEYFKEFKKRGNLRTYYSPELVEIITEEIGKVSKAPEGWVTNGVLTKNLSVDFYTTQKIADRYLKSNPEYFKELKEKSGKTVTHYSPELVKIITEEIEKFKEIPGPPEGWITKNELSKKLKIDPSVTEKIADKYIESNKEFFGEFKKRGNLWNHYSPELVKIISEENNKFQKSPEGWLTNKGLADKLGKTKQSIKKIADKYIESNKEYFREFRAPSGHLFTHYSPELVKIITEEIEKFGETFELLKEWATNKSLSILLEVDQSVTQRIADKYIESNPEFFRKFKNERNQLFTHYSPELVKIITEEIIKRKEKKGLEKQEDILKSEFEFLIQEIANIETSDEVAKKIAELISLLPGNAHDIILKYHPKYKGLRQEYVKDIIAEYLGDFMVSSRTKWRLNDIQKLQEVTGIEGIKEEILINLKNSCLTFVNLEKKSNPDANEHKLVNEYFQKDEIKALLSANIGELSIALKELQEYYEEILKLQNNKPNNIVNELRTGRIFPDINQLVNIQEIKNQKKMLIADEMGLGKSASAILAKEYLGLKCALVVVPSNVEGTWMGYLSDKVNENGKQEGYFKAGFAPRVILIESQKDLEKLKTESFDYILISQEKIGGENYTDALNEINFDMMIVDEVHKLKNIEYGVRSKSIINLSEKIQGENKYLAILSGTPVPNKVKDIGISLKLLYPEKYRDFDSKEMVRRILYGDLINLRSELLKRMQMKELASSIEMPELKEVDISVKLSPVEREIYEILLEEDELTASDKIISFRQFLLNPETLKVEPGFMGSKVEALSETLNEDLKENQKIIVFVNGYIEQVIKGENNIIQKLNLPEDVTIEEIHGEISQSERKRIENEIKSGNKKVVVFVSGQTADVGVDFSGADGLIFYNEPWSNYEKSQQRARVYREGLKTPLTSKTLLTRDSIEEGIRNYSNAKERAVRKLLKGISNTEVEKKLLYSDSKATNANVETNAELSKEYLSDWEKLMIHFGQGFEAGEKRFRQELQRSGKEYADLYKKLGRLTYQGNNARVTSSMLEEMINERGENINGLRILDIASGPEMLKEASSEKLKNTIISTDINTEHFSFSNEPGKTISASYLNLPALDKSFDYVNLGFAFHQTSPIKYYKKNYERLQVLAEMNRVLKPGGRAVISMLHNIELTNKEAFEELVGRLGFKIVPEYYGEVKGGENYKAGFITLEKVGDIEGYENDAVKFASADNARYINDLGAKLERELLSGLEMSKVSKSSSRLRDQRRMIDKITINSNKINIVFNDSDKDLFLREVQAIKEGEELRARYNGIQNIPIEEIKNIGFERKLETPGYHLLYKIIEDGGAVIIRGDYKNKK